LNELVIINFFYKKAQMLALYFHGEVYSIQHYVILFVSVTCDRLVVFSRYSGFLLQ